MIKILFVAHRYYPFPGGTEYYVRDMAEECQRRGYQVTVLAHEHKGDQNGIKVTNDYQNTLNEKWNLIIVHGGDVISQNIIHFNSKKINEISPVVYMLIKPSESDICMNGLYNHRFISYSTSMDINHILKYNVWHKARKIRHGIVPENTIKNKIKSNKKIFVSAGGFWRHKAMNELAVAFENSNIDAELHLYGYYDTEKPGVTNKIKIFLNKEKKDIMQAIANADGYIMNSYEEGFGLVLLEAMFNKTPWFSRNIAAAKDLSKYGFTYDTEDELMKKLEIFDFDDNIDLINKAYDYVSTNHSIHQTVNDIESILKEIL